VLAVLNAASGVLLARGLGPTGRGEVAAVQLWVFFLSTIVVLGIPDAVVYLVARRRQLAGTYVTSAAALTLLASVPVVLIGWIVLPVVLAAQSEGTVNLARAFLVFVPLYAITIQPSQGLRGLASFARWNALRILPSTLWVAVAAAAILFDERRSSFVIYGSIVMSVVTLFVTIAVAAPVIGRPFRVRTSTWGPMLRFGLPLLIASVPQWLNFRLDQLLLAAFVDSRELGIYVVAVAWAGLVTPLVNAIGVVLFPRLAAERETVEQQRMLFRVVRITMVIVTVLVVVLFVLTPLAIPAFFGGAFLDAVSVGMILVVASAALAVNFVLEEGFRGLGRPTEVLWAEIGGLAGTAVVLALLLPRFGIVGAAVASLAGYLLTSVVLVRRLSRVVEGGVIVQCIPRRRDGHEVVVAVREVAGRVFSRSGRD
jgi:O-antigen/teichoic acid export membrane protein